MASRNNYIQWFSDLNQDDVKEVGGKNASLGEMISVLKEKKIAVPDGFATTAQMYRDYLEENNIKDDIVEELKKLKKSGENLESTGKSIRRLIKNGDFTDEMKENIQTAYRDLNKKYKGNNIDVAVRSSATAEDLPEASFAGQQETFLNITGYDDLLEACKKCYASLFTDRAISYRNEKGFDHMKVALSAGVQKMVRSDQAGSGVMFTLDTETGFREVVVINAAWGLGENVVQGSVNPDEYVVFKPLLKERGKVPLVRKSMGEKEKKMIYARGGSKTTKNVNTSKQEQRSFVLNDNDILTLAHWAVLIEEHYEKPMDIEWAKDGNTQDLYIVQARPETVQSQKKADTLKTFKLKEEGSKIISGISIGNAIASGQAQLIKDPDNFEQFTKDNILVTGMTDPDWVPIMKKASGIITDHGGRTSHAAIVSRELGIPALVGTSEATHELQDNQKITLSCAEGDTGYVYEGELEYEAKEIDVSDIPSTDANIMINMASPAAAFRWWQLPCEGIGLARMEFIINNVIKIHPLALVRFNELEDKKVKKEIKKLTAGFEKKTDYFITHLARGIAEIASSRYPDPVIVRMSDFKTNEYADLIGGEFFEPEEENPMLGFRGASRYYSEQYRKGFSLECQAIKKVRNDIGMSNVIVMIPFCRTLKEADQVLKVMEENGLKRGTNGMKVYVMAEIPSNILLAEEFARRFDGFSIGTNDLTQLVLGVDRDSDELSELFDERNDAVKEMIRNLIRQAHQKNTPVGICGQAPSDYPEFAAFLVESDIDSISLNPDSVMEVKTRIAKVEQRKKKGGK